MGAGTMNCRQTQKLFSERIGGRLPAEVADRLDSHLDRCPDCAELLEIMELNRQQLGAVPEPPLPEGLEERLFAIPQLKPETAGATGGGTSTGGHWLFSNAAAAVILAAFITANATWFNPDFRDSLHDWRYLIGQQTARALQLAEEWGSGLDDLNGMITRVLGLIGP